MRDPRFGLLVYTLLLAVFPLGVLGLLWLADATDRLLQRRRAAQRPPTGNP